MLHFGMLGKLVGSVVGVIIGILLGSLEVGAGLTLLGGVIGHFLFDWRPGPRKRVPPSPEQTALQAKKRREERDVEREKLAGALAPIFIEVARADSEVSREEVRVVREFFELDLRFNQMGLGAVSMELKNAMAQPTQDLVKLVTEGRKDVKPQDRLKVVDALYAMALVDGALNKAERDALKQVVANFNLSEEQLQQITKTHLGSGEKHYAVLGLTEDATDDEIRAAFRRLAAENHPDKVASLGKDEAAAASERFREVKDAYEELKKLRGL
jgi:DnaJ like chaperone protein